MPTHASRTCRRCPRTFYGLRRALSTLPIRVLYRKRKPARGARDQTLVFVHSDGRRERISWSGLSAPKAATSAVAEGAGNVAAVSLESP